MASNGFDISLVFKGEETYGSVFEEAVRRWEQIIVSDLPDAGKTDDLCITVRVAPIDGEGGVLGQAAPSQLRNEGSLPYKGAMRFDVSDIEAMEADGSLGAVIMHEMGHVLGLGTLWSRSEFNFIDWANAGYTGEHALAAYRQMTGDPAAAFVPLETSGGGGTAYSHWAESIFGRELMTGYADGDMPVSALTLGALEDLGYTVNHAHADAFVI